MKGLRKFKQRLLSIGLLVVMMTSQVLGIVGQPAVAGTYAADDRLDAAIRGELLKGYTTANITSLDTRNIVGTGGSLNFSGLSSLPSLNTLILSFNKLVNNDLTNLASNLSSNIQLKNLYLNDNEITSLSNLINLQNRLEELDVNRNDIDVTSLIGFTSLKSLRFEAKDSNYKEIPNDGTDANISSLTPLSYLTNLTLLQLGNNNLKDIEFLNTLSKLENLYLGRNKIENISTLSNLTKLKVLDLGANPLNEPSNNPEQVIQTLESRGVRITADLVVTAPRDFLQVNSNKVTIKGLATSGGYITVNNQFASINAGRFSKEVELIPGLNTIIIEKREGNKSIRFQRRIFYDDSIILTSPTDEIRSNGQVKVEGTTKVGTEVLIKVNGTIKDRTFTDGKGKFSRMVALVNPNQTNIVTIEANIGGRTVSINRNIYYDRINPTINAAVNTSLTNQNNILVTGTATDEGGQSVTVTVNNAGVTFQNGAFEKKVFLRPGLNSIKVVAMDVAGNKTEKVINVIYDNILPQLTVTSPETYDFQTHNMTVLVSGTTEEGSKVRVNNIEIPNEKGKFSKELELRNGDNEIIVTSTDPAGNVTTDYPRRVYSYAPSIDEPVDNYRTKDTTITVRGKGSQGTTIKINNVAYKVPTNGVINKVVNLKPGTTNTLTFEYNKQEIIRRVVSDDKVDFSLSSQLTNLFTNKNTVNVSGITETDATVNVKVNDVDSGSVTINTNGNFSKDIPLTLGVNKILITATDFVGNVITLEREVIYDIIPPELSITSPTDKASINSPRVIGRTEPGTGVKINNVVVEVDSNGYFDTFVNMIPGQNNIFIIATDKAGNINTVTKQVNFDTTISLTILEPIAQYTNSKVITVKGTTDSVRNKVKVNDTPVILDKDNNFITDIALKEGKNTIITTAHDQAGNLSEVAKTITLDTVKPIVSKIVTDPYSSNYSPLGLFKVDFVTMPESNNSPIQTYDLQWRNSQTQEWQDLKNDLDKSSAVFKAPSLGLTYYFRVRAKDMAGNIGDWTTNKSRAIIPYDENAKVINKIGFNNRYVNKKSAHYNGTLTTSVKAGEHLTYKFTGNHVALIGLKINNGAKAKIYVDGTYFGTIDTYNRTAKARQVLFTKSWSKNGTHTIKIINAGNKTRYRIDLDAIAIGRE